VYSCTRGKEALWEGFVIKVSGEPVKPSSVLRR
jgi:hypothetical protein